MCGIVGISLNPNEKINSRYAMAALLISIEERGRDATGIAYETAPDIGLRTLKQALPASEFLKHNIHAMPTDMRTAIGHTRMGTQGSEKNNDNNHPIVYDNIIGIHNGMLSNDYWLFNKLGVPRKGQVDSEAAFAALSRGMDLMGDGEPRLKDAKSIPRILELIEGSAALAWLNSDDNFGKLHVARLNYSPVWWGQTALGSFVFASTQKALLAAEEGLGVKLENFEQMDEGTYFLVNQGTIETVEKFKPADDYRPYRRFSTRGDSYGAFSHSYGAWRPSAAWNKDETACMAGTTPVDDSEDMWVDWDVTMDDDEVGHSEMVNALLADEIELMLGDEYFDQYTVRENAIETYMESLKADTATWHDVCDDLMGFVRPGHPVGCIVNDDWAEGQFYELPQTFPEGYYILRVKTREGWVFVAREREDFYVLPAPAPKVLPLSTGSLALTAVKEAVAEAQPDTGSTDTQTQEVNNA